MACEMQEMQNIEIGDADADADVQVPTTDAKKKTRFIVSRKSLKILSLFLIPPSVLVFGWLAIPLGYNQPTTAVVIELYYLYTFFSW